MVYPTSTVVAIIVTRCKRNRIVLTPRRLELILYFIQNEYVARDGETCFNEPFFAKVNGTYLESVADVLKEYGDSQEISYEDLYKLFNITTTPRLMKNDAQLLNGVIDPASSIPYDKIVDVLEYQPGWVNAYNKGLGVGTVQIEDVREFFCQ